MTDSARDFDLLGKSVPQVRVSSRTLALLGFFQFILTPLFLNHISFFLGWCGGVMDSARDFDLLGESVPRVRVSARTLALRGFLNM